MTEQDQVDAILPILTAAGANPFTLDEVKRTQTLPAFYTEVIVSRRFGGERRGGNASSSTGWRLLTRAVANTEKNAREALRRVSGALENAHLGDSTPLAFETSEPVGEDDGWWSGYIAWTYVT